MQGRARRAWPNKPLEEVRGTPPNLTKDRSGLAACAPWAPSSVICVRGEFATARHLGVVGTSTPAAWGRQMADLIGAALVLRARSSP